ncbi:MAG: hypothetical protein A3F17_06460 [Gammaproteobacteria bacterium RIFCSPHIGHO2_12_FULL_41_15]|nr:MAG: hypothetical protein A3F17_06460 [Gammaproteobacteria bacterium RIFCSPHIGHO2_12_FULL_41_15]
MEEKLQKPFPATLNIAQYCLENNAKRHPDKTALIIVHQIGDEERWTYRAVYLAISQLSAGLKSLDYPAGSRFVIRANKDFNFIILYFAALAASLVPIASLSELTSSEVLHIIRDSEAVLYYEASELALSLPLPTTCTLLSEGKLAQLKVYSAEQLAITTQPNDPAFLVYTSGSTGKPKGVLHAHRVILGRAPIRRYWLNLQFDDIVLITGKPCWTYSMGVGFMDTWVMGATSLVYTGPIAPNIWFRLIEHYKVTLFASNPTYYQQMLAVKNSQQYDLSSLRQATSAGVTLPPDIIQYWKDHFQIPIYEALGMSEMSTFISSGHTVPIKLGYVGKIQPGRKVTILPLEGGEQTVPCNTIGLLAIHKDNLAFMLGYLNDNSLEKYRGPWFITGDLVSGDSDGYIAHHGRFDDLLIVTTGDRVSPTEVEAMLTKYPGVLDAACAVTNEKVLTAFLVMDQKISSTDTLKLDITHFLKSYLVPYKVPQCIVFVQKIPRNVNGKIIRAQLKNLKSS